MQRRLWGPGLTVPWLLAATRPHRMEHARRAVRGGRREAEAEAEGSWQARTAALLTSWTGRGRQGGQRPRDHALQLHRGCPLPLQPTRRHTVRFPTARPCCCSRPCQGRGTSRHACNRRHCCRPSLSPASTRPAAARKAAAAAAAAAPLARFPGNRHRSHRPLQQTSPGCTSRPAPRHPGAAALPRSAIRVALAPPAALPVAAAAPAS